MRVTIPEFQSKKECFNYLIKNKTKLVNQKKSLPIFSDPSIYTPFSKSKSFSTKSEDQETNENEIDVKLVGNVANWVDSHMDLILPNAPLRSIKNRKHLIPHLHDHEHKIAAEIGDVEDIYLEDISLLDLGLEMEGSTQALIMESKVKREYNERAFLKYKNKKAYQHSIGLQYIKLELAINNKNEEKEYDFFKKYYDQIINKESVDSSGFFWVIPEYKLIEISLVLFGANELTPTLDSSDKGYSINGSSSDTRKLKALNELLNKF